MRDLEILIDHLNGESLNYLRAEMMLGYVVRWSVVSFKDMSYVVCIVQGYKFTAASMESYLEENLKKFETYLGGLASNYDFRKL